MRHAPFFVTLPTGDLVNVDQITFVSTDGVGSRIHFAVPLITGNLSGNTQMGGSGNSNGSLYTHSDYIQCSLSPADLLALINKEVALVHALETAAGDHN